MFKWNGRAPFVALTRNGNKQESKQGKNKKGNESI
jgi:hypothetical protein